MSTNILVVDDETDLLELLDLNLSAEGYTVRTVETAAEALSARALEAFHSFTVSLLGSGHSRRIFTSASSNRFEYRAA